uniref:Fibronectin type-III domain-containing protein n=1 Tax=Oreochromis niloticus TaxID=8128 RepID=A0A669CJ80_ORENI
HWCWTGTPAVGILPKPVNVSLTSLNFSYILKWQAGPGTPPGVYYNVEYTTDRKQSWKPVPACVALRAGQTCDLTRAFKDPFDHYVARVQAFTATQRSSWTVSDSFQPLSDTVIGPPDVAVSGCGNCLILHLTLPEVLASEHLKDSHTDLIFHVRRTRDGAEVCRPYTQTVISYLQTGVEYCVTASVRPHFSKAIPSEPQCAFTSPPPRNLLYMLVVLLGAFCALAFLLVALVIYGSRLTFSVLKTRLPKSLVTATNQSDLISLSITLMIQTAYV